MDDRPIGMFDSGFGGLTVARALIDLLPSEDLVYVGDTARYPYGSRSLEEVRLFASQITRKLVEDFAQSRPRVLQRMAQANQLRADRERIGTAQPHDADAAAARWSGNRRDGVGGGGTGNVGTGSRIGHEAAFIVEAASQHNRQGCRLGLWLPALFTKNVKRTGHGAYS